jgi:unsaturated chondroitin disaccharide hydrolase
VILKGGIPVAEPRLFDQSSLQPRLEQAFDFAARQVGLTVERTPDYFPIYTVGGRWLHRGELWTDWCGGVHAGMMWLIACRTGDSWWRRTSEHYSGLLEHRQHDRNVHDLGFLFLNTYLPWYQATGDERLQAVLTPRGAHWPCALTPGESF